MDNYQLSERDICTKFITPAIQQAGWRQDQFYEEVKLTDGRVVVRGTLAARVGNPQSKGGPKRADYVLYARRGLPIAVVEAKQACFSVGHGMQQALAYAEMKYDVTLIMFDEEGKVIPRPDASEWEQERVRETVKRLKLNEHVALAEARRKIWQKVDGLIADYTAAKIRYGDGANPAAKTKMNQARARIRELVDPTAELSSVARWCLRLRYNQRNPQGVQSNQ